MGEFLELPDMLERRQALRRGGHVLVFTNGCFDLLHRGHVEYLAEARALGDRLLVGMNDDASVRRLKGPDRPLMPLDDRARMLCALRPVDFVVSFSEDTPAALISALLPDVLVKGGDYAMNEIVGRETVERGGGRVVRVPYRSGYSTSDLIKRIRGESSR